MALPTRYAHPFLPITRADMQARGWEQCDIIIVTGDAYVDHPAFGPVLIARFLEGRGFKVGIIPQPDWHSAEPFKALGPPRMFFGVAAGNLDSMLNRLTAQKKNRSEDQYSPGGRTNCRPDRATIVYAQRCREAYPDVPIVLGGIEASLRRIAHFDYWSEKVRRSILFDAKADLLVFGMGERPIMEVADRMRNGERIEDIRDVRGTAYLISDEQMRVHEADPAKRAADRKTVVLPPYESVVTDKQAFAVMSRDFQMETNPGNARPLAQRHGNRAIFMNAPALPLEDGVGNPATGEKTVAMDELYDLPFNRVPHPLYKNEGIPAYETVKHSIVLMRGCFGGCTFCSITEHEGRVIQSRSAESVLREVRALRRMGDFRGTITDLGGPTANMYKLKCKSEDIEKRCRKLSCVHPGVCENLQTDHGPLISLMKDVREEEGVKHVFIASGVRYDLAERSPEYVKELAAHHVGGQLSVAPEHVSPRVLEKMKKPGIESFERFQAMFACASEEAGKEQYDIPYFISGHPGSTLEDMVDLALWLKKNGKRPRQVQDFIPTPMAMATAMYFTGIDPLKMEPVYTAQGLREKRLQKALLLYWNPEHWPLAREALRQAGRSDLIGRGPQALVPPETPAEAARRQRTEGRDADDAPRDTQAPSAQPRPSGSRGPGRQGSRPR
ncbi:YgiQ family radical SAM protein [Myxococcus llanfairpwllgwyngyllgogerychwyrndrobwllllantysiliogogogochensis]|uniref:YgiQ family radical SAM protein n=1 Tax=Myxococcus llanfairpwllgwyngyllgogerychwyrndrobwllllantysiliogogogochensis TaxID=2590453 RepID=A0A540WW21_9BACT|nr:YgiQ family radical SAM protein [Myxococcus llanfairpwllgwyngyllgogerychwyrndrobwllllantysiliogogogochensis]TQF13213.1 YgiQ family radical SAM protein [Myxococcus llanfairpwllgwyngyllgogerychwyrndrobwllllantysiliogogogochensis]